MLQNNQEQTFRDWVKKAKYEDLVKSFNNSCLEKKRIIKEEITKRFYSGDSLESVDYKVQYEEIIDTLIHYCRQLDIPEQEIKQSLPVELVYKIFQKTEEYKQLKEKASKYIVDSNQSEFNFCFDGPYCPKIPEISAESLERRINRKLP